jgi:protein-L-isoaspartate(D-aspartate) O-methyltransferase
MNIEQARFNMIEQQIRPWDVLDLPCCRCWPACGAKTFVPPAYRRWPSSTPRCRWAKAR